MSNKTKTQTQEKIIDPLAIPQVNTDFFLFKTPDLKHVRLGKDCFIYTTHEGLRFNKYNESLQIETKHYLFEIYSKEYLDIVSESINFNLNDDTKVIPVNKIYNAIHGLLSGMFGTSEEDTFSVYIFGLEHLLRNGLVTGPMQQLLSSMYNADKEMRPKVCFVVSEDFKGLDYHNQLFLTVEANTETEEYNKLVKDTLKSNETFGLTYSQAVYIKEYKDVKSLVENVYTNLKFSEPINPNSIYVNPKVESFINQEREIRKTNNPTMFNHGVVFFGSPGNGKSLSASYLGQSLGLQTVVFNIAEIMDSHVGQSAQNMNRFLSTLKRVGECVLFVDEMDKIFEETMGESHSHREVLGLFLKFLNDNQQILPVFTANRLTRFPKELLRPGRVDMIIEFRNIQNTEESFELCNVFATKYFDGQIPDIEIPEIVELFLNCSISTLEATFKRVSRQVACGSKTTVMGFRRELKNIKEEASFLESY